MLFIQNHATSKISISKGILFLATFIFVLASFATHAGGLTKQAPAYSVPTNLTDLSTEEVKLLRASHNSDLENLNNSANTKQAAEEKMLKELLDHDLLRLSITDVIPNLIEEYEIDGEFKETLLSYRSTFLDELMATRENIGSLRDYQSYDFRFAAVYMSMLFSFQEHPDFYERLKKDMVDDKTSIGGYRQLLDDSYGGVEKAREEMNAANSTEELQSVITALDEELARRSN